MSIVVAILALSFLILIHEFGHFITARKCGIKVLEFSIFMGPEIYSFNKGEIKYTIRAIPIGGYVKMEGEEENSDDKRAFRNNPVWKRALVSFAGSFMNLLLGFILFFILIVSSLMPANDISMKIANIEEGSIASVAGFLPGDEILKYNNKKVYNANDLYQFITFENYNENKYLIKRNNEKKIIDISPMSLKRNRYRLGFSISADSKESNVIGYLEPEKPAYIAGLQTGDKIIALNNTETNKVEDIQEFLQTNEQKEIAITILRDDEKIFFNITPYFDESFDVFIGYSLGMNEEKGILYSIKSSYEWTVSSIRNVYYGLNKFITAPETRQYVSGPVGIVGALGDTVKDSKSISDFVSSMLSLLALISVNLGIFNLLPIPALDGSKLVILGIEKIRGKAMAAEKEATITLIGFVLLISLMIFTVFNDLLK